MHLWQPELLDMSQESHRIRWESLKASCTVLEVHDTLDAHVAEWAICHAPAAKHDPTLLASTLATLMEGRDWDTFGVWVHYPWSGRLVHVLPEEASDIYRARKRNRAVSENYGRNLQAIRAALVDLRSECEAHSGLDGAEKARWSNTLSRMIGWIENPESDFHEGA